MLNNLFLLAQQQTSAYDAGKIAANVFVGIVILIGVVWVCKKLFKSE